MAIQAKIKIVDKNNSYPNVNIPKILSGISHQDASYSIDNNTLILTTTVPSLQDFGELKRRLSAKKNRPNTILEVIGYKELANG